MKTKEFLEVVTDLVRMQLPPELQEFQVTHRMSTLLKLYYQQPAVHYEVWVQKRKGEIEVGLHFEGDADSNSRNLAVLAQQADAIESALGDNVEIASWDRGWTRAHETVPLVPLNDDFVVELSLKVSGMIRTLEPLLRRKGVGGSASPTTS